MPDTTVPTLSPDQKHRYLQAQGIKCPVCGSEQTEGTGDLDLSGDRCTNEMSCLDCNACWLDVYQLHDVVLTVAGERR